MQELTLHLVAAGSSGEHPEEAIPVRLASREGRTLLECREAALFLSHITGRPVHALVPGAVIRGVVVLGEGAYFEVLDQFGRVFRDPIRIGMEESRRLLEAIW